MPGTPDEVVESSAVGTPDEVVDLEGGGGGGGGAGVASFNSRTGAVAPAQADYDSFFLTPAEGDAAYPSQAEFDDHSARHEDGGADEISLAGLDGTPAALTTHAGAADPHTGYVLESLFDAKGDLIAASADNTPSKLTVGANGTLLVAASGQASGLQWRVLADGDIPAAIARDSEVAAGYTPRASVATYADRKDRTSGDLTLNSTTWANVDTGLDIVLTAATGDWIEVGMSALWGSEAVIGFLDVVTVVGGSPVNSIGSKTTPSDSVFGIMAWRGDASVFAYPGGSMFYKLVAGDISSGTVTLRLRYLTYTAANKTLYADTINSLTFFARNHG